MARTARAAGSSQKQNEFILLGAARNVDLRHDDSTYQPWVFGELRWQPLPISANINQ